MCTKYPKAGQKTQFKKLLKKIGKFIRQVHYKLFVISVYHCFLCEQTYIKKHLKTNGYQICFANFLQCYSWDVKRRMLTISEMDLRTCIVKNFYPIRVNFRVDFDQQTGAWPALTCWKNIFKPFSIFYHHKREKRWVGKTFLWTA